LLECRDIAKSFGGVDALRSAELAIREGEVAALIGPNGAGKTTLFNCLTGFIQPDRGTVRLDGRPLDGLRPHQVARRGLVRTFQSIRMLAELTVLESVLVGQYANPAGRSLRSRLSPIYPRFGWGADALDRARETLELLDLWEVRNRRCTDLPLLAERKVEVARALAAGPRVLLLDEPSAGATPAESEELIEVIRVLQQHGLTVLVIEHTIRFVTRVSDTVWVMHFGEMVASGTPAEVQSNELVRDIYLGADLEVERV
jgi:branched-chain amino acid transport system ATP-binding protein